MCERSTNQARSIDVKYDKEGQKWANNVDKIPVHLLRLTVKKEEQQNCLSYMRTLQPGKEGEVEESGQITPKLDFGQHKHVPNARIKLAIHTQIILLRCGCLFR